MTIAPERSNGTGQPNPTRTAERRQPPPIPYVTSWTSETTASKDQLRLSARGLYYADEVHADRDAQGVLWARTTGAPGEGRPKFKRVHSVRQRDAMLHLRCQVCAGPASRTRAGVLFLDTEPAMDAADVEDTLIAQPPLCLPCAGLALRYCPSLGRGHVAVRARKPTLYGVFGAAYLPTRQGLVPEPEPKTLAYGTSAVRFVVAAQLLRQLRRVTLVDLGADARSSRRTPYGDCLTRPYGHGPRRAAPCGKLVPCVLRTAWKRSGQPSVS